MTKFDYAVQLVKRFDQFREWRFFEPETKGLFARILVECTQSNEHANAVVSVWCATRTEMATEAELRQLAKDTPPPAEVVRPDTSCPKCRGDGRESFWGLVTRSSDGRSTTVERIPPTPGKEVFYLVERPALESRLPLNQSVAMFSAYCECPYGRHLRVVQSQPKTEEPHRGNRQSTGTDRKGRVAQGPTHLAPPARPGV
jgi:hypothetical protein